MSVKAIPMNKRKKLIISVIVITLALAAAFTYIMFNYRYYVIYGIYDTLRKSEKSLLVEYDTGGAELNQYELEKLDTYDEVTQTDSLILVNSVHQIPSGENTSLADAGEGYLLGSEALDHIRALFSESEKVNGEKILFTSTYRSYESQAAIYAENPFAVPPGTSEHQCGLAADIKVDGYAQLRFIMSDTGKWMAENAHRFGFIIRYPFWGKKLTGVTYEPWHLRYVGAPHAEIIYRMKLTLEEYSSVYTAGEFYVFGGYLISYQINDDGILLFPAGYEITVSPDNTGGYFIWALK